MAKAKKKPQALTVPFSTGAKPAAKKKPATKPEHHPDVKGLVGAGMDAARAIGLAAQHGVQHPAVQTNKDGTVKGATLPPAMANPGTGASAAPTTPGQYAADVLIEAGLPDSASNEKLLETQMTEEGMPGYENNPLATTVSAGGSSVVPSGAAHGAGVQEFPNLFEGSQAEAQTLQQKNMQSIYNALKSGTASPQDYAKALAGSAYEGYDPAANASYANAFLADAGQPAQSFSGGVPAGTPTYGSSGTTADLPSTSTLGTSALSQAMGSNPFANVGSLIPGLGTASSNNSLQGALAQLGSGAAQDTLTANTSQAPGSPDQTPSVAQQTQVNPASLYQAQLAALLPQIKPGNAA